MKTVLALASFASMASAVCNYGTTHFPRSEKRSEAVFGYHGLDGPLNWHGVVPESGVCATGTNQSPINVIPSELTTVGGSSLAFEAPRYPTGAEFENLGTTVQVYAEGTVNLGGTAYNLVQFHFHTPSEHHINGEYFAAEVHFVFQDADANTAVVGFPIDISSPFDASPLLTSVLHTIGNIPNAGDITTTGPLDFSELQSLLSGASVYQYSGSLTTPPCREEVAWNVVGSPLTIDVETFKDVKSILKFNSRYTQNKPGQVNLLDNARNVLDDA